MYNEINGKWVYATGDEGTVTVPQGARVLQIVAHAHTSGTVAIFGGDDVPIIGDAGPTHLRFLHGLLTAPSTGNTIVFAGTDSYFVEYVLSGYGS